MVNHVAHNKAAHDGRARQGENLFAAIKQRPALAPTFFARVKQRRSSFCDVLIKSAEQSCAVISLARGEKAERRVAQDPIRPG